MDDPVSYTLRIFPSCISSLDDSADIFACLSDIADKIAGSFALSCPMPREQSDCTEAYRRSDCLLSQNECDALCLSTVS